MAFSEERLSCELNTAFFMVLYCCIAFLAPTAFDRKDDGASEKSDLGSDRIFLVWTIYFQRGACFYVHLWQLWYGQNSAHLIDAHRAFTIKRYFSTPFDRTVYIYRFRQPIYHLFIKRIDPFVHLEFKCCLPNDADFSNKNGLIETFIKESLSL